MKISLAAVLAMASLATTRAADINKSSSGGDRAEMSGAAGRRAQVANTCDTADPLAGLRPIENIVADYCFGDGFFLYQSSTFAPSVSAMPSPAPVVVGKKGGGKGEMSFVSPDEDDCNCFADIYAISAGLANGECVFTTGQSSDGTTTQTEQCSFPIFDVCTFKQTDQSITTTAEVVFNEDCCDADGECDTTGSALITGNINIFGYNLAVNGGFSFMPASGADPTSEVETLTGISATSMFQVTGFQRFLANERGFLFFLIYTCEGEYNDCSLDTDEFSLLNRPTCEFPFIVEDCPTPAPA